MKIILNVIIDVIEKICFILVTKANYYKRIINYCTSLCPIMTKNKGFPQSPSLTFLY